MAVSYSKPAIHEAASLRLCSSCKRPIMPGKKAVAFLCPNCGKIIIWRCYECRKHAITYRCPNCGFEGP
ncbi:MAG: RNA-binding protein [Thermoprotei archaeon]|nr:MAG: RNA-binding protein [Thermoprotei archaeon]